MEDSRRRTEPRGITIIDLMVLTLGSAIALSIREFALFPFYSGCDGPSPIPVFPRWAPFLFKATRYALNVDVALSLVFLARCLRWRRSPRPSEWLAFFPVLTLFVKLVGSYYPSHLLLGRGWLQVATDNPLRMFYRDLMMVTGGNGQVLLGLIVGLAFALISLTLRRSRFARARVILSISTVLALYWGTAPTIYESFVGLVYGEEYIDLSSPNPFDGHEWHALYFSALYPIVVKGPTGLMFGIAIIATISNWRGGRRLEMMDWATFASLMPLLAYELSDWFYQWPTFSSHIQNATRKSVLLTIWFAFIAMMSWFCVRGLGPAWNRAFGESYDRSRPASPPSEAWRMATASRIC